jgi:putative acyl-CoA dehydrogenase
MQPFDTHEVRNTVAPFANINLFAADPALQEACSAKARRGGGLAARAGRRAGQGGNAGPGAPRQPARPLHNYDRAGHRIDEVEFHPAWHQLMAC